MRKTSNLVLLGSMGLCLATAALSGCSYMNSREARETGRSTNQVESDKATTIRVSSELERAPVYKFPSVHVQAFNGVVQLSGFVASPEQKRAAVQMAQSVPGVSRVIDNLAVQSEAPAPTGRTNEINTAPVYHNSDGAAPAINNNRQ